MMLYKYMWEGLTRYIVFPTNSVGIQYYFCIQLFFIFQWKSHEINKDLGKNIYDKLLMQIFYNAKCKGGIVLV